MPNILRSSRLAGRAPRHPRCCDAVMKLVPRPRFSVSRCHHPVAPPTSALVQSLDALTPMPTPARPTGTFWQRLTLIVSAPVVFLLLSDVTIRVTGIETDVARNENFEIGVPVWLLGDENWVDIQRVRLEEPRGFGPRT